MMDRTIRFHAHCVNTIDTQMDETEGARLRVFLDGHYPRSKGGMEQLAKDAGLRRGTLYAWFKGKGRPQLASVGALARACEVERWEVVAAMDGYGLAEARRAAVAEDVEAAVAPLRELMREAGLLPEAKAHGATAPAAPGAKGRAA